MIMPEKSRKTVFALSACLLHNIHMIPIRWQVNMKIKTILLVSVITSLLLGACGLIPSSKPVTDDAMQTEIVMLLTSMVTATPIPPIVETPAPVEPSPTYNPSMLPGVLVTATPEAVKETVAPPVLNITPSEPTLELLTFTPDDGQASTDELEEPKATSTPSPSDPVDELGDPDFIDTFDNGDNWFLGKDSFVDLKVSNGNLVMIGLSQTSGWRMTNRTVKDGYVQLIGKMIECKGADGFGLMVRVPNVTTGNSGYLFGVTCDGKYGLRKWNGEKMLTLINWKANDAIKKGSNQTNRLGISLIGNEIKLYVNGVYVGSAVDKDFRQGGFGLFISARETDKMTALLDEIALWNE